MNRILSVISICHLAGICFAWIGYFLTTFIITFVFYFFLKWIGYKPKGKFKIIFLSLLLVVQAAIFYFIGIYAIFVEEYRLGMIFFLILCCVTFDIVYVFVISKRNENTDKILRHPNYFGNGIPGIKLRD